MSDHALIERDDSLLIVIDAQTAFLKKLPETESRPLAGRISWLIGVATWLHIPLIVTAEDISHLGGPAPEIAAVLGETPVYDKMIFGLASVPEILEAVQKTGRQTAILCGLETDVCVAQSALGLMARGYRTAVVADATGSPGPAHTAGIDRMRGAGVAVISTKGLYYELIRTVEQHRRFRAECAHLKTPEGLYL